MKTSNSNIFKAAHKRARFFMNRKMNKKYNYSVMFSFFLKKEYANVKKETAKILTNIIKETEKAIFAKVSVTLEGKEIKNPANHFEGYNKVEKTVIQKMWIPKSQIENGKASKWFLTQNNYISITN